VLHCHAFKSERAARVITGNFSTTGMTLLEGAVQMIAELVCQRFVFDVEAPRLVRKPTGATPAGCPQG
jgi:hypothetical protein